MHPALRKGPLFTKKPILHFFYKKNIPMFHFFTKPFSTFFTKKTPPPFSIFFTKNTHFISCLWACNVAFNDKSQGSVATRLRRGEIFNWHFYKYIAECASEKKLLKSVNIWQHCRQEDGLQVDDGEQKQFPVTLMTQMRIIHHSVGCAVWTLRIYFRQLIH